MEIEYLSKYDKRNPKSIEAYAQKLIGKTFRQVIEEDEAAQPEQIMKENGTYGLSVASEPNHNKGKLGQIIEERFFHYRCNSDSCADFCEAGVELKVTPYRINKKKGSLSAKERLILTMIDYKQVVYERFEESHLWNKSRLLLLVYYQYAKEIANSIDYRIDYCSLFTPPEQDINIIRHDYYVIVSKIKAGKAHELSESDTLYLGAAPKASTSKDRREQPFSSELAKPRAFAYKSSYMTYVLNTYIVPGKVTYEPIVQDKTVDSLEDYVIGKINQYRGYYVNDLCREFGMETEKKPKSLEALLAYRILGIKGNHAEEFVKANIVVKAIRISKNNRIKESMSFPAFRFQELAKETWEDSTFGNYLRETRFLFVVYKFDENGELYLRGCQFWNIPYEDLETDVKHVWERTQDIIRSGLQIKEVNGRRENNFPKSTDNPVCHVRPHAKNANDTDVLPDGRLYPKQCFWLNNTYICNQIDDELKK